MKTILVTTTINIPTVLRWYRACSAHTHFIVVGDAKTPHREATQLCADIGAEYLHPDSHNEWKCAALIGDNSIQKRNIGFLHALRAKADVVVSVDDDNAPLDSRYFDYYRKVFQKPFSGLQARSATGFFDIGDFLVPRSKQRGVPHDNNVGLEITTTLNARIGVAQGLCIGAPDVNAATRFSGSADVHQISEVARAGFVVDPESNTIWNSQNTAIIRQLAPAWGMVPFVQRMDDIYASIVAHRVMRAHGYYAHYGLPMVFQARNPHNLIKDMRGEIDGYEIVEPLAAMLDHAMLPGKSVIDDTRRIWELIAVSKMLPDKSVEAMMAYIDDCETVL